MENVGNGGNGQTIVPPQQMTPTIDERVNSTKQNGNRNGGP